MRPRFLAEFSCEREQARGPCLPLRPVTVRFNTPVPKAMAMAARLQPSAGVAIQPREDNEERGSTISEVRFVAPLPENTRFRVVLPAGLKDETGRRLANAATFPLEVSTGGLPPLAKFAGAPFGIVEAGTAAEPGMLPLTLRHVQTDLAGASTGGRVAIKHLDVNTPDAELLRWHSTLRRDQNNRYETRKQPLLIQETGVQRADLPQLKVGGFPTTQRWACGTCRCARATKVMAVARSASKRSACRWSTRACRGPRASSSRPRNWASARNSTHWPVVPCQRRQSTCPRCCALHTLSLRVMRSSASTRREMREATKRATRKAEQRVDQVTATAANSWPAQVVAGIRVARWAGMPMHAVSGVSGAAPVWREMVTLLHMRARSHKPRCRLRAWRPKEGTVILLDPEIPASAQHRVFAGAPGQWWWMGAGWAAAPALRPAQASLRKSRG